MALLRSREYFWSKYKGKVRLTYPFNGLIRISTRIRLKLHLYNLEQERVIPFCSYNDDFRSKLAKCNSKITKKYSYLFHHNIYIYIYIHTRRHTAYIGSSSQEKNIL